MRRAILALIAAVLAAAPAMAGDVTVDVRDQAGKPVRDAVVMILPAGGLPPGRPIKVSWPMVMAQQNVAFTPYVLIVPLGATVSFPNRDKVRHHVYSFSRSKRFELKLYGREETRTMTFDNPGPVSLGCNIHDRMIAFIYVTETPFAAKSGADGLAVVHDAPAGNSTLSVWHPDLKAKGALSRPLPVTAASQRLSVGVELRPGITR